MLDFGKSSFTFNFNPDSFFQRSPNGISYRIPKKWLELFNQHIKRIAEKAVGVAKSYTSFSNFRDAWQQKTTKGGTLGIIDSIVIHNIRSNGYITYKSKYSNSNRTHRFKVSRAIQMLEHGREGGYLISARNAEALTLPPYLKVKKKNGRYNLSRDRKTAFFTEVTGGELKPTRLLSNTLEYMKNAVNNLFTSFKEEGIENTTLSQVKPSQMGKYTKVIRTSTKNTRGKR